MEAEVRRPDVVRGAALSATQGGECSLQRLVADLSLNKEMLQEVVKEKL
jgi:hypothetical protein